MEVIALLAPALLAALVVTQTFGGEGSELTLDARAIGVGGAASFSPSGGASCWRSPSQSR